MEDGAWKILKLGYNMLWQAGYEKGWSGSQAIGGVERRWAEDPLWSDEFVGGKEVWPRTRGVRFRFRHPVTGVVVDVEAEKEEEMLEGKCTDRERIRLKIF